VLVVDIEAAWPEKRSRDIETIIQIRLVNSKQTEALNIRALLILTSCSTHEKGVIVKELGRRFFNQITQGAGMRR